MLTDTPTSVVPFLCFVTVALTGSSRLTDITLLRYVFLTSDFCCLVNNTDNYIQQTEMTKEKANSMLSQLMPPTIRLKDPRNQATF